MDLVENTYILKVCKYNNLYKILDFCIKNDIFNLKEG